MKKVLAAVVALALAGVANANIIVLSNNDNVTSGTPVTRTQLVSKNNYILSMHLNTGTTNTAIYNLTGNNGTIATADLGVLVSTAGDITTGPGANGGVGYYLFLVTNSAATNVQMVYDATGTGNQSYAWYRIRSDDNTKVLTLASNNSFADSTVGDGFPGQTWNYDWSSYGTVYQSAVIEGYASTNGTAPTTTAAEMLAGGGSGGTRVSKYAVLTNLTTYANTWNATPGNGGPAELRSFSFVEIPEPATIGLLGLGSAMVFVARRSLRAKKEQQDQE